MPWKSHERGVQELRRAARASEITRESAFDGCTAEQCLNLLRACWRSGWDILPDELTQEERAESAQSGLLSVAAQARLTERHGAPIEYTTR